MPVLIVQDSAPHFVICAVLIQPFTEKPFKRKCYAYEFSELATAKMVAQSVIDYFFITF